MSRTDLISDAFTIMRNAITIRENEVLLPFSGLLLRICEILKDEGYIDNFIEVEGTSFRQIKVYLRYDGRRSMIKQIKKVSTPGRRVYLASKDIPSVLRDYGIAIVSTSKGVLTGKQAKEAGVGGEFLGMVW